MTQGELTKFSERLRQARTALERDTLGSQVNPLCAEGRLGCTYTPGARVFDRVSGQEGTVLRGARENIIVATPER